MVSAHKGASYYLFCCAELSNVLLVRPIDGFELVDFFLECLYLVLEHQNICFLSVFPDVFLESVDDANRRPITGSPAPSFGVMFVLVVAQAGLAYLPSPASDRNLMAVRLHHGLAIEVLVLLVQFCDIGILSEFVDDQISLLFNIH